MGSRTRDIGGRDSVTATDRSAWAPLTLSSASGRWVVVAAVLGSGLVPDARLAYTTPAWRLDAFVEVDLATEGTRFFSAKIGRYVDLYRSGTWSAHLPTWPAVLTVTPTLRRASTLRVATEGVLASSAEWMERATKFAFAPLDEVLGGCGPLGAIWQVAGREGLQRLIPEDGHKAPTVHE